MKKMLFALLVASAGSSLFADCGTQGCCNECPPACLKDILVTKEAPVQYRIHTQWVCPTDCNTPGAVIQKSVQPRVQG